MNTQQLRLRKPALIVSDMHIPMGKGKIAEIFKLGPDGMPAWITYAKSRTDAGIRRTVKLIGEMREIGAPIILTTYSDASGERAEILPMIRKAVKKYPHFKIIGKEGHDAFSNPELKEFLNRHGADAIVLCGGERGACAFQTAHGAIRNGYSLFVAEETLYVNKPYAKSFGDFDVVGWVADFDSIYMNGGFSLRDAENRRCAQMDIHNLEWLARSLAAAIPEIKDKYNREGMESLLAWALEKHTQLAPMAIQSGIGGTLFESGLLGREKITEFYSKNASFHETADEMLAAIRAALAI